jgi:hypothetical protein
MKKAVLFILIVTLYSCYYDKENDLYPVSASDCDTTDMSFVSDIKPVLTSHCIVCHSSSSSSTLGGGVKLENYSDVKAHALNGSLYGSVSADPEHFVMPRDYRIPQCSVQKIKAWINDGAQDN